MIGHVVLLGDSIFDNAKYVRPGPDVIEQLRSDLGPAWDATLSAIDGDVTAGVVDQLKDLPGSATHLIVSAGGNDALGAYGIFEQGVRTVAEALDVLTAAREAFARDYAEMVSAVRSRNVPAAFCTIYDANFPEPESRLVRSGIALFNDMITRAVFELGAPLIDLRLICSEPADYANPIEPSVQGGEKIASAIASLLHRWPAGDVSTVSRGRRTVAC